MVWMRGKVRRAHCIDERGLYGGEFGGHSHLALQLCLIAFEGLLSAILEIIAGMMLWKTMFATELDLAVRAFAYDAQDCRGALGLGFTVFELTTFLAGHRRVRGCGAE